MSYLNLNNIFKFLNKLVETWESSLYGAQLSKFSSSPAESGFSAGRTEKEHLELPWYYTLEAMVAFEGSSCRTAGLSGLGI